MDGYKSDLKKWEATTTVLKSYYNCSMTNTSNIMKRVWNLLGPSANFESTLSIDSLQLCNMFLAYCYPLKKEKEFPIYMSRMYTNLKPQ